MLSLGIIFSKDNSKEQLWLLCTILFLAIYILSRISRLNAVMPGEKIADLRFAMLGASYMIFTCFMFTMSYYQYRISRILTCVLFVFHTIIFVVSFNFDKNSLFYSSYMFEEGDLITKPGPLYFVHVFSLLVYLIIMIIGAILYKRKYRNKIDNITWVSIFSVSIIQSSFFFLHVVLKLMYINFPDVHDNTVFMIVYNFDKTEAYYVLFAAAIFIAVVRYRSSDLLGIASHAIVENINEIVVIFDKFGKKIYSNQYAENVLRTIAPSLEIFEKEMEGYREDKYYCIDNVFYELKRQNLNGGVFFTFTDNTQLIHEKFDLIEDVSKKNADFLRLQENLIRSFADMVELRDDTTGSHTKRTAYLVMQTANKLCALNYQPDILNDELMQYLEIAAVLHDIGKIAVPDAILNKQGKLTDEEFEIIKLHPKQGADIIEQAIQGVENTSYLQTAHDIALYHHEKWNGTGYPNGLCGEEIPVVARIMALADVYDALTAERPYKAAMSYEKATSIIKESIGSHFDPYIGEVFLEVLEEHAQEGRYGETHTYSKKQ
nr:HD domain-containing phosphohydrolase [Anaerosporobacter sp.]